MSGDGPRAFDQRLASLAVRPLARTPVGPNMLTALALLVGLAAAWMFAAGDHVSQSWGGGLFMVAVWMDHCDGELARLKGATSTFGHYFDHAVALMNYVAMFVGVGLGLGERDFGNWQTVAGIVAGLAVAGIFGTRIWLEERVGREVTRQTTHGGFQIEDILYVVGPIAWFGWLQPFLAAAVVGAPAFLAYVLWDAFGRRAGRSGS